MSEVKHKTRIGPDSEISDCVKCDVECRKIRHIYVRTTKDYNKPSVQRSMSTRMAGQMLE